jgi:type II secretory pathway component PulF
MQTLTRRTRVNCAAKLSWGIRRRFYEQAEAQIENGKTPTAVLADFSARLHRRGRAKQAQLVDEILTKVRGGDRLPVAMDRHLGDLERTILTAAERGSRDGGSPLPRAMRLILEVREMTGNMRMAMLLNFVSPALFLIVLYGTLAIIGAFDVPHLAAVLPIGKWTGWAYAMYAMGQVATGWAAPFVFGSVLAYASWSARALPEWTGDYRHAAGRRPRRIRLPGRAFFDRNCFPFTVYREITGFVWLMSYAALMRAGLSEPVALAVQIESAPPWLASRLQPVYEGVKSGGDDLASALRRSGFEFPSADLIDEVGAYVGYEDFADKLESVLRRHAKSIQRRLVFKAKVISAVFSTVMFIAFVVVALGSDSVSKIIASSMGQ